MQSLKSTIAAVKKWLGTISPSCREASRLQSEALDHPLTPIQRLGLRVHLLLCAWCRRYGRQLQFLRQAARRQSVSEADSAPRELTVGARERMRRALREHRD